MFTNEEGEGWQQLGEGLMPSSSRDASVMLDGLGKMGEQTIHGLLGGTSMPELHDALNVMYNPKPIEFGAANAGSQFPQVDFFDSGTSSSMLSGAESAAAPGPAGSEMMSAAPTGGESMLSAGPTGGESMLSSTAGAGGESLLSQAFPNSGESLLSQAFPQTGGESLLSAAGPTGGTIETLQTPGSEMLQATPGTESAYFQPVQGSGVDSVGKISDASPLTDIGKAVTDIMSKMTDMIGAMAQGPMGLLGGLLNFLLTIFTEILSAIGTAMAETARAAAALAAEVWKKQLQATT